MALAWSGTDFTTEGGSETEESDSEQPLTESQQLVAILDTQASRPPPLPAEPKLAPSTAAAVLRHIQKMPESARHIAHDYALATPIVALTVAGWIDQQLDDRRTQRVLRLALAMALNPTHSIAWLSKKTQCNSGSAYIARGLALHLRCHPFTRSDVQHGLAVLAHLAKHREQRNRVRTLLKKRTLCGTDTLDVAVVLIGFQSQARHFGAHRYRYLIK
jgi:hypothetical protein